MMRLRLLRLRLFIALVFLVAVAPAWGSVQPVAADTQERQPATSGVLALTLSAPPFELVPAPDGTTQVALLAEAEHYTYQQPEGRPRLPHRQLDLVLTPDADLASLELVIGEPVIEELPGTHRVKTSAPWIRACGASAISAAACLQSSDPSTQAADAQPIARLVAAGQMRKWRVASLDFAPFPFDEARGRLSVVRSVTVEVRFRRDSALLDPTVLADTVMDEAAAVQFDNYTESAPAYAEAREAAGQTPTAAAASASNDYLILAPAAILQQDSVGQFMLFLREHGHNVTGIPMSTVASYPGATTADKIRSFLQTIYVPWGLRYVLLIGNPDPVNGDVPMKWVYPNGTDPDPAKRYSLPTDAYYVDLTGNWDLNGDGRFGEATIGTITGDLGYGGVEFWPEVYVGRVPVYNNDYATLATILHKITAYEGITRRQPWQDRALLPMTFFAENYDAAVLGELLRNNELMAHGYSSIYRVYMNSPAAAPCNQVSTFTHDHDLVDQVVVNYWSQTPVGLMVEAGHGAWSRTALGWGFDTTDCWLSGDLFNYTQATKLDDTRPAFTFHNSCDNGWPEATDNVQYALLRQGAVATVAATRETALSADDTLAQLATNYTSGAGIGYNYVKELMLAVPAGQALADTRTHLFPGNDLGGLGNSYIFYLDGDPAAVLRVPPIDSLNAPSNLSVERLYPSGQLAFYLHWQDNSSYEEYYRITMNATDGSGGSVVEASRNAIAAMLTSVACGKTYNIQVQAVNGNTVSPPSPTLQVAADPCVPAAPTGLTASPSGSSVVLHWNDPGVGEDGFHIYRDPAGYHVWHPPTLLTTVGPNVTSFSDSSVSCGSGYIYRVSAFNASGESPYSASASVTTQICPPPAASNLAAQPAQTSVKLTWTDNSNWISNGEDGFEVWAQLYPLGLWWGEATLPANTTTYLDSPLTCSGVSLRYKVVAFNAGGRSTSNMVVAATSACTQPAAPTNLLANVGVFHSDSIPLSWTDNSNNEYGFKIEREASSGRWSEVGATGADDTGYTVTGLSCGERYTFRVKAYNTQDSLYSNVLGTQTAACDSNMPTRLSATVVSATEIDLAWTPPRTLYTPTGYHVSRTLNPIKTRWQPLITVASPSYNDTRLTCGTTYYYSVNAFRTTTPAYESSYTAPISATTTLCAPAAPVLIRPATVGQHELEITWLAPAGTVAGYTIERSTGLGDWRRIAEAGADATSFVDRELSCGTRYLYRVQAFNAGGTSPYSNEIAGQTLDCAPTAAAGLIQRSASQTSITLYWDDRSNNETGFRVERSAERLILWTAVVSTTANTRSYENAGLDCGRPYLYRVFAFNNGGDAESSNVLKANTLPCAPALTATPGIQELVTLTWLDQGQNATGYRLERSPDGASWASLGAAGAGATSFRDLNAPCGTTLTYRIAADGPNGSSPWSAPARAVTTCAPTTNIRLTAAAVSSTAIHLEWQATAGGQTSYTIERTTNLLSGWGEIVSLHAGVTSYDDIRLLSGRTYFYRVRAVNAGGSRASNVASARTDLSQRRVMLPFIVR